MKLMSEQELLNAINNHSNLIEEQTRKRDEFYNKLNCIRCNENRIVPILYTSKLFTQNNILPNYLARCLNCGVEWEPLTNIEIKLPHH